MQACLSDDVTLDAVRRIRTLVGGSEGGARAAAMTADRAASEAAVAIAATCPAAMLAAALIAAVDANMVSAAVASCSRHYAFSTFRQVQIHMSIRMCTVVHAAARYTGTV